MYLRGEGRESMKKRYDWAWLAKMIVYGLATLGLIYFGLSTILAMMGNAPEWSLWALMIRR